MSALLSAIWPQNAREELVYVNQTIVCLNGWFRHNQLIEKRWQDLPSVLMRAHFTMVGFTKSTSRISYLWLHTLATPIEGFLLTPLMVLTSQISKMSASISHMVVRVLPVKQTILPIMHRFVRLLKTLISRLLKMSNSTSNMVVAW